MRRNIKNNFNINKLFKRYHFSTPLSFSLLCLLFVSLEIISLASENEHGKLADDLKRAHLSSFIFQSLSESVRGVELQLLEDCALVTSQDEFDKFLEKIEFASPVGRQEDSLFLVKVFSSMKIGRQADKINTNLMVSATEGHFLLESIFKLMDAGFEDRQNIFTNISAKVGELPVFDYIGQCRQLADDEEVPSWAVYQGRNACVPHGYGRMTLKNYLLGESINPLGLEIDGEPQITGSFKNGKIDFSKVLLFSHPKYTINGSSNDELNFYSHARFISVGGDNSQIPHYRFAVMVPKSLDFIQFQAFNRNTTVGIEKEGLRIRQDAALEGVIYDADNGLMLFQLVQPDFFISSFSIALKQSLPKKTIFTSKLFRVKRPTLSHDFDETNFDQCFSATLRPGKVSEFISPYDWRSNNTTVDTKYVSGAKKY